jgi:hypothetical protein
MRKRIAVFFGVTVLALGTAGAAAAEPFLCPIVGDNGVAAISPAAGTSLLPGRNQAGDQANANAYNEFGGPDAGNTPGTPGFTPIWNP